MRLKIILLLLCFAFVLDQAAFCLDDYSTPNTFVDSSLIRAGDFNENNDSVEAWISRLNDTLDERFVRFSDISGGDSSFSIIKTDTIRSNPDVDSIKGYPYIDSIETGVIRGNPDVDSINGRPFIDSIDSDYMDVIKILTDTIANNVIFDTLVGDTIKVELGEIDTLIVDSVYGRAGGFYGAMDAATLNTGQGDNELYDMDQNVLTTSEVQFKQIDVDTLMGASDTIYWIPSGGENMVWYFLDSIGDQADTVRIDAGTLEMSGRIINGDIITGMLTALTVNTGHGNVECYYMDQDVGTTDNVTFNKVTIDSLTVGPATIDSLFVDSDTLFISVGGVQYAAPKRPD